MKTQSRFSVSRSGKYTLHIFDGGRVCDDPPKYAIHYELQEDGADYPIDSDSLELLDVPPLSLEAQRRVVDMIRRYTFSECPDFEGEGECI